MIPAHMPDNPAPAGGLVETIRTSDGLDLRVMRFVPQGVARATVMITTGRAETTEKYYETIGELLARDFVVVIFDWRGQGGSARQLEDRDKGHVADFAEYQRDLHAVIAHVLVPHCPKPWFALGHSMGGAILIEHAHDEETPFERMVLCAPMIDLVLQYPNLARFAARSLHMLGLGRMFVPTGGRAPVSARGFERNPLTTDRFRFERLAKMLARENRLSLGDPTVGWVHAAFALMAKFRDPDYPQAIATPMLILASQDDWVTDSFAAEHFCGHLQSGRLIFMPAARHEILMERDEIRARFWGAFDSFIPGVAGEGDALLARPTQQV